jgi:hypothetical protein
MVNSKYSLTHNQVTINLTLTTYFPLFLLPSTSSPGFNKKLQGILLSQKAQFEETEQILDPDSDMAEILELSDQEFKITQKRYWWKKWTTCKNRRYVSREIGILRKNHKKML